MSVDREQQIDESDTAGPDLSAARRWAATLRRIDRVEFTSGASVGDARIHGVGHRLPVTRRVPRRVGLGLVALGYRATVRSRES